MVEDEREEETLDAAPALRMPPAADPRTWLEPIYREHAAAALRTAYRFTGNLADAEDVLHTVFMRLATRRQPPDLGRGALSYLRRAVANAACDLARSRRVQASSPLEEVPPAVTTDHGPAPDRLQFGRELRDRLREAIAALSPRHAEMFTLRYFEGLDNADIATALGTTPGTVAVTLHRIRARLSEELAPYLGGTS